ncbi:transposase [Escherichia coli]|nr:transposase [Escherichia coli O11:H15]EGK4048961.1 transposase [Escherichia coli]EGK4058560.1 transposase [Escherichia coli]EII3575547.1 hypothetical protein [Escherichia coli]HCD8865678.1 hypothetical protein [Escherichia coli]
MDDARVWINRFVNWYNFEHQHNGIKYATSVECHQGNDMKILVASGIPASTRAAS